MYQLLEHQQTILASMETGTSTDVVYLDFAKAYDKVDYGVLVSKLRAIGINGQLLKWINRFLSCPSSTEGPVISGILCR